MLFLQLACHLEKSFYKGPPSHIFHLKSLIVCYIYVGLNGFLYWLILNIMTNFQRMYETFPSTLAIQGTYVIKLSCNNIIRFFVNIF